MLSGAECSVLRSGGERSASAAGQQQWCSSMWLTQEMGRQQAAGLSPHPCAHATHRHRCRRARPVLRTSEWVGHRRCPPGSQHGSRRCSHTQRCCRRRHRRWKAALQAGRWDRGLQRLNVLRVCWRWRWLCALDAFSDANKRVLAAGKRQRHSTLPAGPTSRGGAVIASGHVAGRHCGREAAVSVCQRQREERAQQGKGSEEAGHVGCHRVLPALDTLLTARKL